MTFSRLAILAPVFLVSVAVGAAPAPVAAPAAPAAQPAAAPKAKLSSNSTIGELLGNPAAAAVLEKYMPGVSTNPKMLTPEAAVYRFSDLKPLAPDIFTDATLAAIDADLAALPQN